MSGSPDDGVGLRISFRQDEKDLSSSFAWLEKAYAEKRVFIEYIKAVPDYDSDPRYTDLLKRMGLS